MSGLEKSGYRLLKILSRNVRTGYAFNCTAGRFSVFAKKTFEFTTPVVRSLIKHKAIKFEDDHIRITRIGMEFLARISGLEPDEHSENKLKSRVKVSNERTFNTEESPLARLFMRKTKSGKAYLTSDEFHAGERLRADFERGNLQPRISANLSATAGLSGKGGFHQAHEISDFAIDARIRVDAAMRELGPELSGVTLDICCFLKGLETVERERQWPPRSAKLMLKTALATLARHYGISEPSKRHDIQISGWGGDGYRPPM